MPLLTAARRDILENLNSWKVPSAFKGNTRVGVCGRGTRDAAAINADRGRSSEAAPRSTRILDVSHIEIGNFGQVNASYYQGKDGDYADPAPLDRLQTEAELIDLDEFDALRAVHAERVCELTGDIAVRGHGDAKVHFIHDQEVHVLNRTQVTFGRPPEVRRGGLPAQGPRFEFLEIGQRESNPVELGAMIDIPQRGTEHRSKAVDHRLTSAAAPSLRSVADEWF